MIFEPEKITRRHVLKAARIIEEGNIKLNPSTGYDVIINQKRYPPKEIIRIAHELATGSRPGTIYGGESVNKYLRKLDFEVVEKVGVWKLGCNWGKGAPSFYNFIKKEKIVLSVEQYHYEPGDLVLITEGFTVYAIATVTSKLFPITQFKEYKNSCEEFSIDYNKEVQVAKAEWYELSQADVFTYQLQQGIRKVRNREMIDKAFNLLEERNIELENLIFYTKDYHESPGKEWNYPCVILVPDSWNDWGYYTTFELFFYKNREDRVRVGTVKILQKQNKETQLPKQFTQLDNDYCSLGQTVKYYQNLSGLFPNNNSVLKGLNDCVVFKENRDRFQNDEGFSISLLRSSEAELLLKQNSAIITAIDEKTYDFVFSFKLPQAIKPHSVNIKFNTNKDLPNNFFCIIGKNGTGKTQFLAKLANKLTDIKEDGEIYPDRPDFSKIISASFSYFDKFQLPKRKDTSYTFIGLRNNSGIIDENEFGDILWTSYMSLVSNKRKKDIWLNATQNILDMEYFDFDMSDFEASSTKDDFINKLEEVLSSGQKIVFQFITRLINAIEYRSLVIFDEPETHLHPNIAARLLNVLNDILKTYQSHCLVATHSPIIVQEVPSSFIRIFDRQGDTPLIYEPTIECFGENLSIINNSIFHVDEEPELYKSMLDLLLENKSIAQIEEMFDGKLSLNAKLYLQLNRK